MYCYVDTASANWSNFFTTVSSPDGWIVTGKVSSSLGKTVPEKSSLTASMKTNLDLRGSSNDKLPF